MCPVDTPTDRTTRGERAPAPKPRPRQPAHRTGTKVVSLVAAPPSVPGAPRAVMSTCCAAEPL